MDRNKPSYEDLEHELNELRAREKRYLFILENSADFITSVDRDGIIRAINRTLPEMNKEDAVGRCAHDYLTEDCRQVQSDALEEAFRSGRDQEIEVQGAGPDGAIAWYFTRIVPVASEDGVFQCTLYSTDITARKKLEVVMRSEETARSLLSLPEGALLLLDLDYNIIDFNTAFAGRHSVDIRDMAGKSVWELMSSELATARKAWGEQVKQTGQPVHFEDQNQGRYLENIVFPLFNAKGDLHRLAVFSNDITKRKKIELQLQENESRFRTIFDNSPVPIWEEDFSHAMACIRELPATGKELAAHFAENPDVLVDIASRIRILDANRAALQIFRASDKQQFIENYADFFCEETMPAFIEFIKKLASGESISDQGVEVIVQPLQGEKRTINLSWSVVPGHEQDASKLWFYAIDITERRRMEDELQRHRGELENLVRERTRDLREAHQRFKIAAEISSDIIYEWTVGDKDIQWFGNIDAILGYENGEFDRSFEGWFAAIHPEDRARMSQALDRHFKEGTPYSGEFRVRGKDGSWRVWMDKGVPVFDEAGAVRKWIGVCQDITEMKAAQEVLVRSEQKYRGIFDESVATVYLFDAEKNFIDSNQAGLDLLGYTREELLGMSIPDVDADPEVVLPAHGQLLSGDRLINYEHKLRRKDGTIITVLNNSRPIADAQGNVMGIQSTLMDITERKQAEQAMRESEERYRRLSEDLPDIVTRIIPGEGMEYVNSAFEDILKIPRQEVINNWGRFMAYVHPDDMHILSDAFKTIWQQKKDMEVSEYRVITPEGNTVWLEAIWKPQWTPDGNIEAIEAIARDITDRKLAEAEREDLQQQLVHSQKMEAIGTMAGGIAHDFNNILATISGTAEMLINEIAPDAPYYLQIDRILRSSSRARDLTMKLLTFARKEKLNIQQADVNDIVRDVVDMLEGTVSKKIRFDFMPDPALGPVNVDSTQILQAVLNVCINACDAMPDGGVLGIRTGKTVVSGGAADPQGTFCVISISDTGKGMEQDVLDKIFEPFFTTKARGKGSGLGLSVSHGIIKAHNGFIRMKSDSSGSTFYIHIPVATSDSARVVDQTEKPVIRPVKGTIFIIDDDLDFVNMAVDALQLEGFRVITALSGKEAVPMFEKHSGEIDIVMLDMILPEMDGTEIFHALREIRFDVVVVLCSGYSFEGDATELLEQGAAGFVQKPFKIAEIKEVFARLLTKNGISQ